MIILDSIKQGTPEWFKEKLGKPSASNMKKIITPKGQPSEQRQGYLFELAAERIKGAAEETYQSPAMLEGKTREQESRELYEFINSVEVEQVGIIYKDTLKRYLCSPDGLIDRIKGLELKNVLPKTQASYLYYGKLPNDYFVQVHSSIFISGYSSWDFMSHSPGLPPFMITVERDDEFCAKLEVELHKFCNQLDEITDKLRSLS